MSKPSQLAEEVIRLRQSRADLYRQIADTRNLIWMLVASAGGEIRISYPMVQDNPKGRELVVETDPRTLDTVYKSK